jgi:hypothetical protein
MKKLFLLDYEPDFDFITQDSIIVKQILDQYPEKYVYKILKQDDFKNKETGALLNISHFPTEYKNATPVGSIQFISAFTKIYFDIEDEPPIEIPNELQTKYFLKREYRVLNFEGIPSKRKFFIKDITKQKKFSMICNKEEMTTTEDFCPEHQFLVSEVLTISAEYRIYVYHSKILNISRYKGDASFLPDLLFINNVIEKCSMLSSQKFNCYSFDIMMTDRGAALIEIHSYNSLGLYSTKWDERLLLAYIESFDGYIKNNIK